MKPDQEFPERLPNTEWIEELRLRVEYRSALALSQRHADEYVERIKLAGRPVQVELIDEVVLREQVGRATEKLTGKKKRDKSAEVFSIFDEADKQSANDVQRVAATQKLTGRSRGRKHQ